jgi:hypothetical protein
VTPRIARAEPAPRVETVSRTAVLDAEQRRLAGRLREIDGKLAALAREFAAAQGRLNILVVDDASADSITSARRTVAGLRETSEELNGARGVLVGRLAALRRERVPVAAAETLRDALAIVEATDAVVRACARELGTLVPRLERAVAEQWMAERQLAALMGDDSTGGRLHALADAGAGYLTELKRVTGVVLDYDRLRSAPPVERNAPAEPDRSDAESPTPPTVTEESEEAPTSA